VSGRSREIVWDTSRPVGEPSKVADITRARSLLGFAPQVPLAEGIARTMKWLREFRAGTAAGRA
jgi:GDP-L-fucose synthase